MSDLFRNIAMNRSQLPSTQDHTLADEKRQEDIFKIQTTHYQPIIHLCSIEIVVRFSIFFILTYSIRCPEFE